MSTLHIRITEENNNRTIELNRPDMKTGRIILNSYSFYYIDPANTSIHELICYIPFLSASSLNDVRESGQMFHLPVQPDPTGAKHTVENLNLEVVCLEDTIPWIVPLQLSYYTPNVGAGYSVQNFRELPNCRFVLNLYFTFADNM